MRLGTGEFYDPEAPDNSARIEAQIIYFQVATEEDVEILKRLGGDIYAKFGEAFSTDGHTGPILEWNVVASPSFDWSLLENFENRLDEDTYLGNLFRQRRRELSELRTLLVDLYQTTTLRRMGAWTLSLCPFILADWKMDERLENGRDERKFGDRYRYRYRKSSAEFEPPIPSPSFHFLGHSQYWKYLLGKSFYEYQHEDELADEQWEAPPHWEGDAAWKDPSCYPHGYLPISESRKDAKKRISDGFNKWLDTYLDAVDEIQLRQGRERVKDKRAWKGDNPLQHFEWLYHYQVKRWTYERISLHFGADRGRSLSTPAISDAVRKLAKVIGIAELRP